MNETWDKLAIALFGITAFIMGLVFGIGIGVTFL